MKNVKLVRNCERDIKKFNDKNNWKALYRIPDQERNKKRR